MELRVEINYPCLYSIQIINNDESIHIMKCDVDSNKMITIPYLNELIDDMKNHQEIFEYVKCLLISQNESTIGIDIVVMNDFIDETMKYNFKPKESADICNKITLLLEEIFSNMHIKANTGIRYEDKVVDFMLLHDLINLVHKYA